MSRRKTEGPDQVGEEAAAVIAAAPGGSCVLLENVRFHDGETSGDPELSAAFAALGDAFVGDAFGAAHRDHCSVSGAARLLPSAVVVPIVDETDLYTAEGLYLTVTTAQIADYETSAALTLKAVAEAPIPLAGAENCRMVAFRPADGGVEHLAIIVGDPDRHSPVLTRLHSECFTGDLLASLKCDCGEQLRGAIRLMAEQGAGVLLYLAQEGRGIGLMNKLRAYSLQAEGYDTIEANLRLGFDADERVFLPAAQMLGLLGFSQVRLLTNNPDKVSGLEACGVRVAERVAHSFPANVHNEFYLRTKKDRAGHLL